MDKHVAILNKFNELKALSGTTADTWGSLTLTGTVFPGFFPVVQSTLSLLAGFQCAGAFTVSIGDDKTNAQDLIAYEKNIQPNTTWKIHVNKDSLLGTLKTGKDSTNIFLSSVDCGRWLGDLDPLDKDHPFNKFAPLRIIVSDIDNEFGSEFVQFLPAAENKWKQQYKNSLALPDNAKVKEYVHFTGADQNVVNANYFLFEHGDFSSSLSPFLFKQSVLVLACCIADEFYSYDKVVLDGLRRINIKLADNNDKYDYRFVAGLAECVSWLYQERVKTRKKLFNERLSLEIYENQSLIRGLSKKLPSSFKQAKERYNFVIQERKDAYVKELKDLLKDLRGQSDLYAGKIRTLLGNFLRDALAGIILIGFTIFTKFSDNIGLDKVKLLPYVFTGLGTYYLVSITFQAILDWTDMHITLNELKYWKKASNELINEEEFDDKLESSLAKRRNNIRILYPVIALFYILLAIACFKFPKVFESLMKMN